MFSKNITTPISWTELLHTGVYKCNKVVTDDVLIDNNTSTTFNIISKM